MLQSSLNPTHSFITTQKHVLGINVILLNVAGPDREGPDNGWVGGGAGGGAG